MNTKNTHNRSPIYWLALVFFCGFSTATSWAVQVNESEPAANVPQPLTIAVAANFSHTLKQLKPKFQQQTGRSITIISGATGSLYQQIRHGAPFDLFLAANAEHPELLEQAGLILNRSRKSYAIGQLAFFSHQAAFTFENLPQSYDQFVRFAIANPAHAPYGKAAKQLLEEMQLWQSLSGKLVKGNNVAQSYQFIQSKAATAGLVANSFLIQHQQASSSNVIPQQLYQPIEQQMAILKTTKQAETARLFQQFLLSDAIQEEISKMGYYRANNPIKSTN